MIAGEFFVRISAMTSAQELSPADEVSLWISSNAFADLLDWNLTHHEIAQLIYLTAGYEYANCPEKVAAIPQAYFDKDSGGEEYIIIPDYFDIVGSTIGAECGSIASRMQADIHKSGFMQNLHNREGTKDLHFVLAQGEDASFFRYGNHMWCGLVQKSENSGFLSGSDVQNMVVFDGSRRQIRKLDELGYHLREFTNPYNKSVVTPLHAVIEVQEAEYDQESGYIHEITRPDELILGVSSDYAYSYGLSFLNDQGGIRPVIVIGHEDGANFAIAYRNPVTNVIVSWASDESFRNLKKHHWEEIDKMIESAESIQYSIGLPDDFDISQQINRQWEEVA